MSENQIYCVIGSDPRLRRIITKLSNREHTVYAVGYKEIPSVSEYLKIDTLKNSIEKSTVVILPLPISKDGVTLNCDDKILLDDLFKLLAAKKHVFGGKADEKVTEIAKKYNVKINDYFLREEMAIENAVPTAEGAVEIAMRETSKTIFHSKCLVTGYGKCAKVLSNLLKSMGANVDITARKYSDLSLANINGCGSFHISLLPQNAKNYDVIFNTVPSMIIDEKVLNTLDKTLVIDIASLPGGVDFEKAKKLNVKTIHALSLPGKVAPDTAGDIILKTVLNMIKERGEDNG